MPTKDLDGLLSEAMAFAVKAHGSQMYGHHSYEKHLRDVLEVAQKFWLPEVVQVAAPLHDTLEDTSVTFEELKDRFGEKVANLVRLVTDKPGKNRWERHEATYPEIRKDTNAVALKLCDRIANVKFCLLGDRNRFRMYEREQERFFQHLYASGEWPMLWRELSELFVQGSQR